MARKQSGSTNDKIRMIAENRKARHDYEIEERIEVGLSLVGSEVKTLRSGQGNIAEAYVRFERDEAWLVDAHIPPYPQAHQFNHEPRRIRKLLLKRNELDKWARKVQEKGLTAMPLKLYFNGAWVKLEIGLGRGRKLYDKRHALKEKQSKREMQRMFR
jgi:SsrA-binding protein